MERTNEEKLDLFADLIEPFSAICADKEFLRLLSGNQKLAAVRYALKNRKEPIIEILALIEGVPKEEYQVNLLTLPVKLLNFLNKPEVQELFSSQSQKNDGAVSGSATENTEGGAI